MFLTSHFQPKEGLTTLTTGELCLMASEEVPRAHTRSIPPCSDQSLCA